MTITVMKRTAKIMGMRKRRMRISDEEEGGRRGLFS